VRTSQTTNGQTARPETSSAQASTADVPQRPGGWFLRRAGAYVALTKPRVIELLLVTTVPTMILAADGMPGFWLIVATLVGGAGAAGSANAFNMWWDRDIDEIMNRTKRRPLVTGEISPRAGLVFASILGLLSLTWFALVINWAAMWLTLGAIAIYVVGYTMILKRRTPQNIVWGGIAGCMPVFIGWASVTGEGRAGAVRHHLLLDAAALLAAVDQVQEGLRERERPDASRRQRRQARGRRDGGLHARDDRLLAPADPARRHVLGVHGGCRCAGRVVPVVDGRHAAPGAGQGRRQAGRDEGVPRLDHLPVAALRGGSGGRLPSVLTSVLTSYLGGHDSVAQMCPA
jgi:hypothetical protein